MSVIRFFKHIKIIWDQTEIAKITKTQLNWLNIYLFSRYNKNRSNLKLSKKHFVDWLVNFKNKILEKEYWLAITIDNKKIKVRDKRRELFVLKTILKLFSFAILIRTEIIGKHFTWKTSVICFFLSKFWNGYCNSCTNKIKWDRDSYKMKSFWISLLQWKTFSLTL